MKNNMKQLSVLELDELYYRIQADGASLQELKAVRALQEEKLKELPPDERHRMVKAIKERFMNRMLSPSVKNRLGSSM